jgi:hypothetical protein
MARPYPQPSTQSKTAFTAQATTRAELERAGAEAVPS